MRLFCAASNGVTALFEKDGGTIYRTARCSGNFKKSPSFPLFSKGEVKEFVVIGFFRDVFWITAVQSYNYFLINHGRFRFRVSRRAEPQPDRRNAAPLSR